MIITLDFEYQIIKAQDLRVGDILLDANRQFIGVIKIIVINGETDMYAVLTRESPAMIEYPPNSTAYVIRPSLSLTKDIGY